MSKQAETILGLDIGISSIGWSLVGLQAGVPHEIVAAGVRVFPMGMELDDSGKGQSRNVERREARMRRRQLDRRAMRKATVSGLLKKNGMAPGRSEDENAWKQFEYLDPYKLRSKGIDQKLTLEEFGRAIYHIAQRRGFLSNRKAAPKKDEKPGLVKSTTESLEAEFVSGGFRTAGEYFASLNPHERRIRGCYTLRRWFIHEFELLWKNQTKYHPDVLTPALRESLYHALFDQRPLKIKPSTVGVCELEPGKKRCRTANLDAQRFRILQQINNLAIEKTIGKEEKLTGEQRKTLIDALGLSEDLKFSKARSLLNLKRNVKFNLERGGQEKLLGNTTSARIYEAIGPEWEVLDHCEQSQLVNDLMSIDYPEVLKKRAMTHWGLDEESAEKLSEVVLEDGHLSHSWAAITTILRTMEKGAPYMTALIDAYPDRANWKPLDRLPKFPDLRNPLVQRALAETRRVVNAVIKRYGKPGVIRVELARDLKKSAKNRERDWKRMRTREKDRSEAKKAIGLLMEYGIPNPRPADIEKWLLFKECGGICPYTGKGISEAALFGEHPQFDVEHIIPFSRSLDNSFANKTLCHADYNRNIKKNRTPFEAAGGTAEWETMIHRVENFQGDFREVKLRKFLLDNVNGEEGFIEQFTTRDLAVTQYASKAAYHAFAKLYSPDEAKKRVKATQGNTTAFLRSAWRLNDILGRNNIKTRDDHRHHAIDATVIALTTHSWIKALADASVQGRAGAFKAIEAPWASFKEDLQTVVNGILTSHRVSKKTNGPLHKETYYGIIHDPADHHKTLKAVVRKPIEMLSESEIKNNAIVDKAVRMAVHSKLKELEEANPAKAFKDRANHPCMTSVNGAAIPIHRARVLQACAPVNIESEPGVRNVVLGNNHHVEFFNVTDRNGNPTLRSVVVSQLDVLRRVAQAKRAHMSPEVVKRMDEDGNSLAFSLAIGDAIEFEWKDERVKCVVQKLSNHYYVFRDPNDARRVKDIPSTEVISWRSDAKLAMSNATKLMVDPLGFSYRTRE